jgi:hypothetical protein
MMAQAGATLAVRGSTPFMKPAKPSSRAIVRKMAGILCGYWRVQNKTQTSREEEDGEEKERGSPLIQS